MPKLKFASGIFMLDVNTHNVHISHMSNLANFLSSSGITQEDFAASIGVTQATVSRLASKKHKMKPGLELAVAIERATDGAVPVTSWVAPQPERAAE